MSDDEEMLMPGESRSKNGRRSGKPRSLYVVGALLVAAVLAGVIYLAVTGGFTASPSSGANSDISNVTHCRYSSVEVAQWVTGLDRFYKRVIQYSNLNMLYTCDFWSDFSPSTSKLGIFPLSGNPDHQEVVALRNLAMTAKADPTVTTLEKIQIDQGLADVEYYLNLSAIDHYANQLASYNYDYSWFNDPLISSIEILDTLSEDGVWGWCNGVVSDWRAENPTLFEARVSQWMSNVAPMIIDYQAALQHQLDVNKTHAKITWDFQQSIYNDFFTHNYATLCPTFVNATLAAACVTHAAAANAAKTNFAVFFTTTYVPACALSRPNSMPGLTWVDDGDAAYAILLRYHLGFDDTPKKIYDLGTTRVNNGRAAMLATANQFDSYATFASLVTALGNSADSRFFFCNVSDGDVIEHYRALAGRIIGVVNTEMGYVPRIGATIGISGSPSTYNANGNYDQVRHFWTKAYTYNIGNVADDPEPNNCSTVYDKVTSLSTTMHESFPGHGLQVPLQMEISCQMSRYQFAPTSFVEGWALYVETLGYKLGVDGSHPNGLYTDPVDELGFFINAMLRNNRMQEDPAMNGHVPSLAAPWDYNTAWNSMMNNGFTAGYAKSETERYITMAAQATAYMRGRVKIEEIRNYTETMLGSKFSAPEFHNILTRWGGASLENIDKLIHTYVATTLSALPDTDVSFNTLFGIDLIRHQFSPTLPVVGFGRVA